MNSGASWNWGTEPSPNEPMKIRAVRIYKPNGLPFFEDWLSQNGITGTINNYSTYYYDVVIPAYENIQFKTSVDWNLFTVASVDPSDPNVVKEIDYDCLGYLNPVERGNNFIYAGIDKQGNQGVWKTEKIAPESYISYPLEYVSGNLYDVKAILDGEFIFWRKDNGKIYYRIESQGGIVYTINSGNLGPPSDLPPPVSWAYKNLVVKSDGLKVYFSDVNGNVWLVYRNNINSNNWNTQLISFSNTLITLS